MKAITIKEPYASLISNGVKKIETRSWKTNYRGYLYIHAGKTTQKVSDDVLSLLKGNKTNNGKILCRCKLKDCVYMTEEFIDNLKNTNPIEYKCGKYEVGRYAWILDDIEQVDMVDVKGNLNLWDFYDENEIMNLMENIEYGWLDIYGNRHLKLDPSIKKDCYLQSPKELIKSKLGLCIDQVELQRYYFKYPTKSYIIVYKDNDYERMHTFLTFEKNDKFYWFEHAWTDLKGIYEYNSLDELFEDVKDKYEEFELKFKCKRDKLNIYEYSKPKYNLSPTEFIKHCNI